MSADAISRDGRLVATRYRAYCGDCGESIHLIDVKTGRVVRDARLRSPDEYDASLEIPEV